MDGRWLQRFEAMLAIRRFEERLIRLHAEGAFRGHYHVYIGQEPTAVAACEALTAQDLIFTTHRNHGHLLARGADPGRLLAEILGRSGGYNQGKGGTLHASVRELGIPATSAIVGGSLPLAVGAALGLQRLRPGAIAVAFFGDGALEEGAFHEAANLAALWGVPLLLVCENNSLPLAERSFGQYPSSTNAAAELADLPRTFGIPCAVLDGREASQLFGQIGALVEEVRTAGRPHFVEVRCRRWPGSVGMWPALADGETDLAALQNDPPAAGWNAVDPLLGLGRRLLREGQATFAELAAADLRVRATIERAAAFALESPFPPPAAAYEGVFAAGGDQPCA